MVKGTSRQVVVVRTPDPELFDEAIFLVRADRMAEEVSEEKLLAEADRAAKRYVSARLPSAKREWLLRLGFALLGALGTGGVWALTVFL